MTRRGKPWTADEDDRLSKLVGAGVPWVRIADEMGRTQLACRTRASQMGLDTSAAKWRADDDASLRCMWADGVPTGTICERLGRTPVAVARRAAALGLVEVTIGPTGAISSYNAVGRARG